jgi:DNA-binding transcriptional ArsR family regulator
MKHMVELNIKEYKKAKLLFRALDNTRRRMILQSILFKPKRVTDIVVAVKLNQPETSMHLAILRKSNLVITRKIGKEVYYSINTDQVYFANDIAKKINNTIQ